MKPRQPVTPLDLGRLKVFPLAQRKSLTRADDILVDPDSPPQPCNEQNARIVAEAAARLRAAIDQLANALQPAVVLASHLQRASALALQEMTDLDDALGRVVTILKRVQPPRLE